MGSVLLVLVVVLVVAALVFGVVALLSGDDPGLSAAEPDGQAVPLPSDRPLAEGDLTHLRFDTVLRGYRMEQVDRALRRAAYDVGYKDEMISVLEAEVIALREGREEDAELLRKARESATRPVPAKEEVAGIQVFDSSEDGEDVDDPDPLTVPSRFARPKREDEAADEPAHGAHG